MAQTEDVERGGALETPKDAGKGKSGVVKRWLMAIELADKPERDWRRRGQEVYRRYRQDDESKGQRFNILWSNTEVMRPALYHSTPKPDVRRRYRDEDPVGKEASEILERALAYSVDSYDFDQTMTLAVLDQLLPGRAVTRVRYKPTIEEVTPEPYPAEPMDMDEMGMPVYADGDVDDMGMPRMVQDDPYEAVTYQEVMCEHVHWDDFRRGPGQTWEEVDWIAFRHKLTKRQLQEKFGRAASKVELDYVPEDSGEEDDEEPELFKRAIVWEIWNKEDREVLFIAPSMKDAPLKTEDDPLGLSGFYPIPRPLYALESSDSLVPVELFRLYKDQADELDRITLRINKLISGLKLRGVYDSTVSVMDQLMQAGDNVMLPTGEQSLMMLQQGGSLERAIWLMPIDKAASVLVQLYQNREAIKQTIYEITGLSDIIRGSTDPKETLGAQQLKAQSGSRRLRRMQKEVQRYARDLMRLKAEIMAEHFEPQMLGMMTGKEVSPQVSELIRSDLQRGFRIDIETDSTIAEDEQQDQESMVKLLEGITRYIGTVGPIVQQGYMPPKAAVGLLESIVRRFKFGRKVEDALGEAQDQAEQGGQQQQEDPEAQAIKAEIERKNMETQAEQQRKSAEMQAEQQRREQEMRAEIDRKEREMAATLTLKEREMEARIELEREKARSQAEIQRMKSQQQPQKDRAA